MFIENPHHNPHQPQMQPGHPQFPVSPQSPQRQYDTSANPKMSDQNLPPMPVVKVLSPFGIEYVFMTLALLSSAISTAIVLVSLINGYFGITTLAFPLSVLLVSLPILAFLFLRFKKLELIHPHLRFDASKRRSTQCSQLISFLVCFGTLISAIFTILSAIGGENGGPLWKSLLGCVSVLAVFGGILAYYWLDEHKV